EDLTQKAAVPTLEREGLLQIALAEEALLDEERPERLPVLAAFGPIAFLVVGACPRGLLLREGGCDRQRGHPAARGQDLAEHPTLVPLDAQCGLELLLADDAALDEQSPERWRARFIRHMRTIVRATTKLERPSRPVLQGVGSRRWPGQEPRGEPGCCLRRGGVGHRVADGRRKNNQWYQHTHPGGKLKLGWAA